MKYVNKNATLMVSFWLILKRYFKQEQSHLEGFHLQNHLSSCFLTCKTILQINSKDNSVRFLTILRGLH